MIDRAEAAKRGLQQSALGTCRVVGDRCGEFGGNHARGDGVRPHILRPPLHGHVAGQLGERGLGNAVQLDLRHLPSGHLVQPADIDESLAKIGHTLQPFDIVLMNTVAAAAYGREDYIDTGIGFGREATLHLTNQGVRVVGTDAWGWDLPVSINRKQFEESGDPSIVWEGHKAGADVAYCQIEKLQHLEELPATGFTVACSPAKVRGASAGWTRAVAIFDE